MDDQPLEAMRAAWRALQSLLPGLLEKHQGKFVVMQDQRVFGIFPDMRSAYAATGQEFGTAASFGAQVAARHGR